jgi:hypothetical protein
MEKPFYLEDAQSKKKRKIAKKMHLKIFLIPMMKNIIILEWKKRTFFNCPTF